jgi:NAD(P)-dependent dehydrogenase (short-subunit alcohol dehydrogenase family)
MNDAYKFPADLTGMRAVVTGGAQGIGAAICLGLKRAGADVAVADQQGVKAWALADMLCSYGGVSLAVQADLSTADGCKEVIANSVNSLGGLDILINCAAPGRDKAMLGKLTPADWDLHQKIILDAAVQLSELASEHLAVSGRGVIVNISSVTASSIAIDQCSWPYHVSKAGLDQLTRWLAVRFGGSGIRVNAISPGLVDRDIGHKLSDNLEHRAIIETIVPLRRAGTGEDIAKAVVFLSSSQASYITGQVLTVDGGLGVNEVFGAALKVHQFGAKLPEGSTL